jgi:hypothetical protein
LAPDVVGEPGQVVHELVLASLVTFNPVPESKQEVVLGYILFQFRDAYMHVGTLKTDETVKGPVVLPTGTGTDRERLPPRQLFFFFLFSSLFLNL